MAENETSSKPEPKKYRITKENAAEFCKSAAIAKKARAEMRRKLLKSAIDSGIDTVFVKAIKDRDPDAISVVEKALKLVGLDYASSEEAVQRLSVKADANVKADTTLKVTVEEV